MQLAGGLPTCCRAGGRLSICLMVHRCCDNMHPAAATAIACSHHCGTSDCELAASLTSQQLIHALCRSCNVLNVLRLLTCHQAALPQGAHAAAAHCCSRAGHNGRGVSFKAVVGTPTHAAASQQPWQGSYMFLAFPAAKQTRVCRHNSCITRSTLGNK